jgi:hypothetical protein
MYYGTSAVDIRSSLISRLNSALTPDTKCQYKSGLRAFLRFLNETDDAGDHVTFPLSGIDAALYTGWLLDNFAPGTAKGYRSHLNYFCDAIDVARPLWTALPQMSRIFRETNKRAKRIKRKKLPITAALGARIVHASDLSDPIDHVCCLILLTGISGLFRLGELLSKGRLTQEPHKLIRVGHISFHEHMDTSEYFQLFLQYSKTDKYGIGAPVFIPANPSDPHCCPVQLMRTWIARFHHPTDVLFSWPDGTPITTSAFISWLRRKLRALGIDDSRYAGHSLRRGGAVTAREAGASEPLIQALGRWTSESFLIYLRMIPPHVEALNDLLQNMRLIQPPS